MTNVKTINPEETLIYKELKSKFEVSDPELWKEVSENLKQVIESTDLELNFQDTEDIGDSFVWECSPQGHHYWSDIEDKAYYYND